MSATKVVSVNPPPSGEAMSAEVLIARQHKLYEKFQNLERRMTLIERAFNSPVWGGAICRHVPTVMRLGTVLYCCWHTEPGATVTSNPIAPSAFVQTSDGGAGAARTSTAAATSATSAASASSDGALIHRRIPNTCAKKQPKSKAKKSAAAAATAAGAEIDTASSVGSGGGGGGGEEQSGAHDSSIGGNPELGRV